MASKIEEGSITRMKGCYEQVKLMPEIFAVAILHVEHFHAARLEHTLDCFSVRNCILQFFGGSFIVAVADNKSDQVL